MLALDYKRKQADCKLRLIFGSLSFISYAVSRAICSHRACQAFGLAFWTFGLSYQPKALSQEHMQATSQSSRPLLGDGPAWWAHGCLGQGLAGSNKHLSSGPSGTRRSQVTSPAILIESAGTRHGVGSSHTGSFNPHNPSGKVLP